MVASTNITVKFTVTTWTPSFVAINWNWSYSLEEEGLEVVGHVGDDDEEQGGDVDGEEGAQEPPPQHHPHLHPPRDSQIKGCFPDKAGWKEKSMYKQNREKPCDT